MAKAIKQGDSYGYPVGIEFDGAPINIADVSSIEFMIGGLRKLYPETVTYNNTDKQFYIPLSQAETFAFEVGTIQLDIRVEWVGGNVEGIDNPITITVFDAISEVEL